MWCPTCKEMMLPESLFLPSHECPPQWEICEEGDDEWETIYAPSADEAACRWLEWRHHGSGVHEQEMRTVIVRGQGDTEGTRYTVRMQLEPSYTAVRTIV